MWEGTGRDWQSGLEQENPEWLDFSVLGTRESGHSGIVDIIVQQPNIDYNVKTKSGNTLAHGALKGGDVKCVETLAAQEECDSWNVPNQAGDTPAIVAFKDKKKDILKILPTNNRPRAERQEW